jgi:hypothetical protein
MSLRFIYPKDSDRLRVLAQNLPHQDVPDGRLIGEVRTPNSSKLSAARKIVNCQCLVMAAINWFVVFLDDFLRGIPHFASGLEGGPNMSPLSCFYYYRYDSTAR